MNHRWNKVIYKIWAPVYDRFFNTGAFLKAHKKIFQDLELEKGSKICFVGVGTGADLELIRHSDYHIAAIDFSPDMLERARAKFKNSSIEFIEMDAQEMSFADHFFDAVIGSLILSVVPDPDRCFREMVRVLKPGGKIIIFDKFAPKGKKLSLPKRLARPMIQILGTDIGLSFENLFEKYKDELFIEEDVPVMLNGMYRKIVVKKPMGEGKR